MKRTAFAISLFVLLAAGALYSHYLTGLSIAETKPHLACFIGSGNDCTAALRGGYGKLFGIPVSVFATGFFAFLMFHIAKGFLFHSIRKTSSDIEMRRNLFALPLWAGGMAAVISLLFVGISIFVLHSICVFCVVLYTLVALTVGMLYIGMGEPFRSLPAILVTSLRSAASSQTVFAALLAVACGWISVSSVASRNQPVINLAKQYDLITVVEFADFDCPACKAAARQLEELKLEFPGRLNVEFINFPLCNDCNPEVTSNNHPNSCTAAKIGIVMKSRGKFENYASRVFALKTPLDEQQLYKIVRDLGESELEIRTEIQNEAVELALQRDLERGRRERVRATPTLIIDGIHSIGVDDLAQLKSALKAGTLYASSMPGKSSAADAMHVAYLEDQVAGRAVSPIDSTRSIDWSTAGVIGGIPIRTIIYTTLNSSHTVAQINTAIANCPAGQVVYFSAGTYNLPSSIFVRKAGITLRGAGPGQTIFHFNGGGWADLHFDGASFPDPNTSEPANLRNWTAGFAKGTTTITLASTSGLTVGRMLMLDQKGDGIDVDPNGGREGCTYCGRQLGTRPQIQIVKVTGINGNNVTISPGLYMTNWNTAQQPQAWWFGDAVEQSGIEDITIEHTPNSGMNGIGFTNAYNCWVKNVRSYNGNTTHVRTYMAAHVEVRDSYFYGTANAFSQSYGVNWYYASDSLIENNQFQHVTAPYMLGSAAQGNVAGYNFCTDDFYTNPNWMMAALGLHAGHSAFNLLEGNNASASVYVDQIHGSGTHTTIFRNRLQGWEPGKSLNTYSIAIQAHNRYTNIVGNILGKPGYHDTYECANGPCQTDAAIYYLGYYSTDGGQYPNQYDSLVPGTLMRWGNFDYVTNTARWNVNEIPNGTSIPTTYDLPVSLYRSAKPAWWGHLAWPAIGPEVAGLTTDIPAKYCFDRGLMPNCLAGTPPPPTIPTVTIVATDASAGEPSNPGTFTITRTGAATSALTVNFSVSGTSTSGSDYTALGTSVTIPAGAASATKTVTPVDNTVVEPSETVILTITANAAYTVGTPLSATVTIADNDTPPPTLPTVTVAATDASAGEPSNNGLLTFTRTGSTTAALTVNFSVSGTATSGSDYAALGTSVTIPAGATSANKTVSTIDNTVIESSETVIVTITTNAAYTVGTPASATVSIADNDNTAPVIVSAASATPNPALVGQNIAFSVAASDENGDALTYSWTFGDGTSGTGSSVTHAYAAAGNFIAKATANDGHSKSVSSSVTVTVAAASGVVVDNKNANTSKTGTWAVSAGLKPWASQSLFSNSGGTFRWIPDVPVAGEYQVYAWWTYHPNRSTNVPYKISHAAGMATVNVNQRLSASGGKWNLLGTYSFDAGSGGFVEVSSINGQACADAIRLVPVSAAAAFIADESALNAEGAAAVAPGELAVDALKLKVLFAKEIGTVRLKCSLALPEDFRPEGVAVTIDVCGATASFTFDNRGRAKGANGMAAVKRTKAGWALSAALKNLTWPNQWTEAGVADWKRFKGDSEMSVSATVGNETFAGTDVLQITPSAKGTAGK